MIVLDVLLLQKLQTSTIAFSRAAVLQWPIWSRLSSWIFHGIATLGKDEWPIPDAEWHWFLTAFVVYAGTGTSLWHLGFIAITRLVCIVKPFVYTTIFTKWTVTSRCIQSCVLIILPSNGTGELGYEIRRFHMCCGGRIWQHRTIYTCINFDQLSISRLCINNQLYVDLYLFAASFLQKSFLKI